MQFKQTYQYQSGVHLQKLTEFKDLFNVVFYLNPIALTINRVIDIHNVPPAILMTVQLLLTHVCFADSFSYMIIKTITSHLGLSKTRHVET